MDSQEKTTEAYNKIASAYSDSHFSHFWVEEFPFFKSIIDGRKVIDLGCGAGRDATIFIENGFNYTGVDVSEEMLKIAKERAPKGFFAKMDFSNIHYPDGVFDGFWASASFLHIPKKDLSLVLQETKRITKKNGVGFISVKEKIGIDEDLINEDKYGGISRYFSFYTEDEFKKLLDESGFSIIKVTTHIEDDEKRTRWLCYFVRI